jgi:UDP-N-acetylglucosamine--N-acetylmuramyl-(pentapeptide) pyrophosphoryl-undecaprenol N-acetylglucosamine transferase
MKIVFTGGGTGGHFYPIIAVVEELLSISEKGNLLPPELYYIGPDPYDERALFEHDIQYIHATAGKLRRYMSAQNATDMFKIPIGVFSALRTLFKIFPDVVFSKGGYAAVPTLMAARILRIPIMIHDSDAVPGRVTIWASSFATKIAISYPEALEYFPEKIRSKIAYTGNPVRKSIESPVNDGAFEYLELSRDIPTILFLGGSQGAQRINDVVLESLSLLLEKYQIIHQTGERNFEEVKGTSTVALETNAYKNRYKIFPYLNDLAMRMCAGAASIVVSRAGSGSIFEIAMWQKPAILIPIPEKISRDQRFNAFAYMRAGGAIVIEETNLTPHVLSAEIDRLIEHTEIREQMTASAGKFKHIDAAETLAKEIIRIALKHEN